MLSDPTQAPEPAAGAHAGAALETVRKFYGAIADGDAETALGLIPDTLAWHEAAGMPYAGPEPYHGPAEVAERVLGPINQDVDGLALSDLDFRGLGDSVLVLGRYTGHGRASGVRVDQPFAHIWRFAGATPVEFRQYTDVSTFKAALAGAAA
jgi:ketosteroid isomerase-like protein